MHGSRSRLLQRFLQRSKSAQGITPFVLREAVVGGFADFLAIWLPLRLCRAQDCRSLQFAVQQIVAAARPRSLRSREHRVKLSTGCLDSFFS